MGWREHVDAQAIERAQREYPALDVDALGESLERRISAGKIRNPSAVFLLAAREARDAHTFVAMAGELARTSERVTRASSEASRDAAQRADFRELARLRVQWYAAAARGATPLQIGAHVAEVARRWPNAGLVEESAALTAEAVGWPVERRDVPSSEDDADLPNV